MKLIALATIASSLAGYTYACNPLTATCPPDPALGTSFTENFSGPPSRFTEVLNGGEITYGSNGVELTLNKRFDNPSLISDFYIMFGKVEVVLQAAQGTGIVSSFYLQSDDLDEIDIELFGGDPYEFQSNYFVQGNTTTFDRGEYHPTSSSPLSNFHTYTIEWTSESLSWILDGVNVRTLVAATAPQGYPQTPMKVFAGIWAGGDPSNPPGTIEWAGGITDYSQAPFNMYIKSLSVSDYSTGTQYEYTDQTGFWQSIKAVGGAVNGNAGNPAPAPEVSSSAQDPPTSSSTTQASSSSEHATTSSSTEATTSSTTASSSTESSSFSSSSSSSSASSSTAASSSTSSTTSESSTRSSTTVPPTTSAPFPTTIATQSQHNTTSSTTPPVSTVENGSSNVRAATFLGFVGLISSFFF
ncbi:uncharacterized protein J8A68_003733 [[Candida] subhashii]|uniref:Crh-like protein n=1 Tax=[Candida] subhashii TaxID=561895 RepID=A0A8J5QLL8_9ASCO|nr:uncharacterized protein J8A68_003733 [[Candida] subhashii]KAG7662745.1 hypothetical protein J8A68_003733 [[Candida] subhashii]